MTAGRVIIPNSARIKALDAETINELFGSFDAEQEKIERFREYFVTNSFYDTFSANFPLRIAVGNKGTGKSAVLRASQLQDLERSDCICVSLSASDLIARADSLPADGLKAINHWKTVFASEAASHILATKISEKLEGDLARTFSSLPNFFSWITRVTSTKSGGVSDLVIRAGLDLKRIKEVVFYVDDLDKGWDGRYEGLHFVNSVLNACYDISKREHNIKFRLAIRWDLWDAISRINQDIDKIRQNATFLRWTNHDIYIVLAMRVARFFGVEFPYRLYLGEDRPQEDIARIFDPILERAFRGLGKWDNTPTRRVLLSMTRNRPRDLISLLTLAAEEAHKKQRIQITSEDLQAIFPQYSDERLNDLALEYGTRLAGMNKLLMSFKPTTAKGKASDKFRFTNDIMTIHLKSVLREHGSSIRFSYEKGPPDFRRILDFLYRIDFLQAWYKAPDGTIERVNFQDRQLAVSGLADFGYSWEVLPAYRWAIQPTRINDVIDSL